MISASNAAVLLNDLNNRQAALPGLPGVGKGAAIKMNEAQINAASRNFESLFIGQMMEQMVGESLGTEAFGDAETNDIYKGLIMDEYGKIIAQAGGIGIASYVRKELLKLQEM